MPVVVVTDSTASLPHEVADKRGIVVVPLQVVIGADVYDEGSEGATPELVAAALKEFRPVSTSRPTPAALLEVYEECARRGATEIVSVHLSADMSGTFESAQLAAREASGAGRVRGQPAGRGGDRVRRAVGRRRRRRGRVARRTRPPRPASGPRSARRCSTWTRWSTCGAAAGSAPPPRCSAGALAVKPLLKIEDGRVASLERVRTSAGRWPGSRSWPWRRPGTRRSTSRSRTWPARSGPASCRRSSPRGWRTTSTVARCGAASSVPCSAPTSVRGCSRSAWRRCCLR